MTACSVQVQELSVDAPAPTVPELVKEAAFAPTPFASVALLRRAHAEAPSPVVSTPAELLMREASTAPCILELRSCWLWCSYPC